MANHVLLIHHEKNDIRLIQQAGHLALSLKKRGIHVTLFTFGIQSETPLSELKIPHTHLQIKPHFFGRKKLYNTLQTHINKHPDITHVHFMENSAALPKLVKLCQQHDIPVTLDVHDPDTFNLKKLPIWQRRNHLRFLDRFYKIIVPTPTLLEQASTLHLDNLTLIPPGVHLDRFKPVLSKRPVRRALGIPESGALICCMADIHPDNKQLEVLKLCAPLGELTHLLLIGTVRDPLYLERIRSEAEKTGERPYLHITDTAHTPEDYLKASDVFVLLGGIEARRATILEAQACGVPVVLAPSPNALNYTNGNKTGIVLYPNNDQAKQTVSKLINDPNFRQGRSIHARPFIKKEHNIKTVMDAYATLFKHT